MCILANTIFLKWRYYQSQPSESGFQFGDPSWEDYHLNSTFKGLRDTPEAGRAPKARLSWLDSLPPGLSPLNGSSILFSGCHCPQDVVQTPCQGLTPVIWPLRLFGRFCSLPPAISFLPTSRISPPKGKGWVSPPLLTPSPRVEPSTSEECSKYSWTSGPCSVFSGSAQRKPFLFSTTKVHSWPSSKWSVLLKKGGPSEGLGILCFIFYPRHMCHITAL